MSFLKRLSNVATGTVKVWARGSDTPDVDLEAELASMDARRQAPVHSESERARVQAEVERLRRSAPTGPVKKTDLLGEPAGDTPSSRTDLLEADEPDDASHTAPPAIGTPEPVTEPAATRATEADDLATRVLGAAKDVMDAVPDPFQAFADHRVPDVPASDPVDVHEVEPDEIKRRL